MAGYDYYKGRRLVVRRTRLTGARQARLWPEWRQFGFLTDLTGADVDLDAFHRQHAVVELAIRDLKRAPFVIGAAHPLRSGAKGPCARKLIWPASSDRCPPEARPILPNEREVPTQGCVERRPPDRGERPRPS